MNRIPLLALFALSFAFAQEGAINKPLNLAELSAKDTESFDTYSLRHALVQDSISAMQMEIENSKKKTLSQMPALAPKDEYEKQVEFDARKAKWEKELGEKTQRDSKPFADRLSELEKAKKKIEENQASLRCTVEIKTNPEAASIYFDKEDMRPSPAEYNPLPGLVAIKIQKENYEPWDTTLTMQPAQKLKLNIVLQEKSIFSKEGEIDFPKILAKDTTTEGYRERMNRVKARVKQIDIEIKVLIKDLNDTYPALEPQRPNETAQDFDIRKTSWRTERERQDGLLQYKHEKYRNKLVRSLKALEDNIIATESKLITETRPNARITLGTYDVEKEIFEIEVQDTANTPSPFLFVGKVGIPRDTAKVMNRSTDGFLMGVSYLNYPFVLGDSSFNLAMKELNVSRKAVPLKVDGVFKPLGRFESMKGYSAWHTHADSLLSGSLKAQGLGLDYVLKDEVKAAGNGKGLGLSWQTSVFAFTAAAVFGVAGVLKHLKAEDYKDKINAMRKDPNRPATSDPRYNSWIENWNSNAEIFNNNKNYRTIFFAGAGVFTTVGILTLVF